MYTDSDRYRDLCEPFINDGYITGFRSVVKQGKEATVLLCAAGSSIEADSLALKLYRDEGFRNFRNDTGYLRGKVWDRRLLKRLNVVKHEVWVDTEYKALRTLYDEGVRVPKPYARIDHGILMELVGAGEDPAPLLKDVRLTRPEARRILDQITSAIDSMPSLGVVHADLSAFNILYYDAAPIIIDFPQSVSVSAHDDPFPIFKRDVDNVRDYFEKYDCDIKEDMATTLWSQYYR